MFILRVLLIILDIFYWLIIIRVISSYLPLHNAPDTVRSLLRTLYDLTEPIMAPIRSLLPRSQAGIDFSPLVVILILFLIRRFLFIIFMG